jgi:hypothetical protein
MAYDLYFHNLTDEDHEQIGKAGADAVERASGDPVEKMGAGYDGMRGTGAYERASLHTMHAFRQELRNQGAGKLADCFETDEGHIVPKLLLEELRVVRVIPTSPPDHEHFTPLDSIQPAEVRVVTARSALASMSDSDWACVWNRFVGFLVRAACVGDGVDIT